MAAGSFGRGGVLAHGVAASDIRGGRMMTGNLPVVPSRDSLRVSDRAVNSATASRLTSQHSFYSKSAPAARTESFSSQASRVNESIARSGQFQVIGSGTRNSRHESSWPRWPIHHPAATPSITQQPNVAQQATTRQPAFAIPSSLRRAAARRLRDKVSAASGTRCPAKCEWLAALWRRARRHQRSIARTIARSPAANPVKRSGISQ